MDCGEKVVTILRSTLLAREGFEHGFGTRRTTSEDLPEKIHILVQVHGERIVVLSEYAQSSTQDAGESHNRREERVKSVIRDAQSGIPGSNLDVIFKGLPDQPFRFDEGDAMVCDIPGISMGIRTADCLPLLIVDRLKGAAAAVHCGWRSLALGLAGKAVRVLTGITGNSGKYLLAAIGPSIGSCCYEVGQEVREAFGGVQGQEGLFEQRDDGLYLDLASGVKTQLIMEGMTPETIDEIVGCTSCNPDLFWSWRARKEEERMVSFLTVREPY